jgi:dTMP kinase
MKRPARRKAQSARKGGLFLSFEGGEGAGKSTQIQLLVKVLEGKGHTVTQTREPGGTEIANRIRAMILDPAMKGLVSLAELFLYEASRAQHVEEKIRPALEKNHVVICDRYADSSVVYQGAARGLDARLIGQLNRIATANLQPRVTFLLDIDPKKGFERVGRRGEELDRIEAEGMAFHVAVRKGYLKLARANKKRFRVLDASRTADKIHADIMKQLEKIL